MPKTVMTFKEFQASQKRESRDEFEARVGFDTMWQEPGIHVLSYGPSHSLYIMDHPDGSDFGYSLILERDEYDGYDLERLERLLYEWGLTAGALDVETSSEKGSDSMTDSTVKTEAKAEFPAPVHTVTLDGETFNIRKDFYGRYQVYQVTGPDLERSIGRIPNYASVKEAWDALFVSRMQD